MAEETKKRVAADLCSYVSDDCSSLHLEFTIPGVKSEDIKLKLNDDSFSLSALRGDTELVSTGSFCCSVKSEESKANYENGLLKLDVPFKDPWEDAYEVPLV